MPRYDPVLHPTADRELKSLDDSAREQLTDALMDVAAMRQPTQHPSVQMLKGQRDLFRVRVGEYRAVCELQKPELQILKCGHRSTVYDVIDEIDDRRQVA